MSKVKSFLLMGVPLVFFLQPEAKAQAPTPPMHPLCKSCHAPQPNTMMGFLDQISYKNQVILLDVGTHKELVRFSEKVKLTGVKDLEEIRMYRGRGFNIVYEEKKGEKHATAISRFDIMKIIPKDDILTKKDVENLLTAGKKVLILDSRPPHVYQENHIPNAKNLPAPAFEKVAPKVLPEDKETTIVFYDIGGCLSPINYLQTKAKGYQHVKIYVAGLPDWMQTNPTATTTDFLNKAIQEKIGYVLVDLRDKEKLKDGFIPTAVSVPFKELSKASKLFPEKKTAFIIVYSDNLEEAKKGAQLIHSWGYRKTAYLPITFEEWVKRGLPVDKGTPSTKIVFVPKPKPGTIPVEEFQKIIKAIPKDVLLIDVRTPDEFKAGHIKGALNIPVEILSEKAQELPKDKKIIIYCETGVRAEMGYTALKNLGINSQYLDARVKFENGKIDIQEN